MRRLFIAVTLLLALSQSVVAVGMAAEEPLPTRIGGDRESFEEQYGEPDEGEKTVAFEHEDYASIEAFFHKGFLVWVSVVSPRPEEKSLTKADDADWTVEEAQKVATGFLPRDAKLDKDTTESDEGDLIMTAHSEALEKRFSAATYRQYKAKGDQGDLRVEFLLTKAGDVSSLLVSPGNEDAGVTVPEPRPDPTPTPKPTPTPERATGYNDEEVEYLRQASELTSPLSGSFSRVAELFENPQIGDTEWSVDLAAELALWQYTYQEMLKLDPPPSLEEFHATTLEALALLDEAATDTAVGLDTLDFDRVAQAAGKIAEANRLIVEATRMIEELNEERGL